MHAVAQFMRQCHYIARFAKVVQHDVRMHRTDGGMGKGTGRFAGLHARVNPAFGEKRLGDIGHFRRKRGVGIQHGFGRFIPSHNFRRVHRQGRVAIPDLHHLKPHPFRLQAVIAVRQARVGGDHGIAQRFHHFRLHMVGQVAAMLRRRHLAPAVVDFLFLCQRVVNPREQFDMLVEFSRQRTRPCFAHGAVRVGHQVQRGL